jgi:hypothetical protein
MNADSEFIDFLKTGQLVGVMVGDTAEHVRARFGEPDETTPVAGYRILWAYSGRVLQLTFDGERVCLIALYPGGYERRVLPGSGAPVPFAPGSAREDVLAQIARWGLSVQKHGQLHNVYTAGGVMLIFGDDGM